MDSAVSLAASLTPSVDHAVWESGQKVQLTLKRMYDADAGAPQSFAAEVSSTLVEKPSTMRSMTHRSPGTQPTSE